MDKAEFIEKLKDVLQRDEEIDEEMQLDDIVEFSDSEKRQLGLLDDDKLVEDEQKSDLTDSDDYNSENIH